MPLWERLMDLADTMVSSKTQWSRMSDGATAICSLFAESSSELDFLLKTSSQPLVIRGHHYNNYKRATLFPDS